MPNQSDHVLVVGRDGDGHWVVQHRACHSEGLFASREAAMRFARWEARAFPDARIELSAAPLASILAH